MFWGDRDALKDEIKNLQEVREGPNIVQLYEVFEEHSFCYLVTELMLVENYLIGLLKRKHLPKKRQGHVVDVYFPHWNICMPSGWHIEI